MFDPKPSGQFIADTFEVSPGLPPRRQGRHKAAPYAVMVPAKHAPDGGVGRPRPTPAAESDGYQASRLTAPVSTSQGGGRKRRNV